MFSQRRAFHAIALLSILAWFHSSVQADTSVRAVESTAGITTGLVVVATSTTLLVPDNATLDWGDGSPVDEALLDCRRETGLICDFLGQHLYTEPGEYTVTVRYRPSAFAQREIEASTSAVVSPVGNFVIVSVGDSNASGEGNPVRPQKTFPQTLAHPAYWDHDGCNRSSLAGSSLAAERIRQENPELDVTFLHLACSGAQTGAVRNQIAAASQILPPGVEIDALIVSVGGNDAAGGFGGVVLECVGPVPPEPLDFALDCSMSSELETRLSDGIASLPGKYASLGGAIDAMRQPVANVLITEYPDMTRAKDGEFPDWWVATTCSAGLIKPQEWEFLHDHLLVPLNDAVESASFEHGWEYVDGMKEAFRHHGYCASPGLFDGTGESYIVKIFESLRLLGEENGTAHADLDGQRVYRDALVETINRLMTPATTASTGAVGRSIEVSLEAYNRLPTSGVKRTYYAVDRPDCGPESLADCVEYSGPFRIDDAGDHQLTYFSENLHGSLEKPNTVRIVIEAP